MAGSIHLARYWMMQTDQDDEWTDRLFGLLDAFINLVLIPGSYLLNDEAKKLMIYAQGWLSLCRTQIVS